MCPATTRAPSTTTVPTTTEVKISARDVQPWAVFNRTAVGYVTEPNVGADVARRICLQDLICDTFVNKSEHKCRWRTVQGGYWTVVTEARVVIALGGIHSDSDPNGLSAQLAANHWPSVVAFADAPVGPLASDVVRCQSGPGQVDDAKVRSPPLFS